MALVNYFRWSDGMSIYFYPGRYRHMYIIWRVLTLRPGRAAATFWISCITGSDRMCRVPGPAPLFSCQDGRNLINWSEVLFFYCYRSVIKKNGVGSGASRQRKWAQEQKTSDTGNRTPGFRVQETLVWSLPMRGDNVSHYTISDDIEQLKVPLRFVMRPWPNGNGNEWRHRAVWTYTSASLFESTEGDYNITPGKSYLFCLYNIDHFSKRCKRGKSKSYSRSNR